jgi:hypothetical protein
VFTPHLPAHNTGIVGAISDSNDRGVVDQMRDLLPVVLIGRSEVNYRQLTLAVNCCMELETVLLTLPVLAEAGNAFSYLVSVSPHQLTDMEHGRVHEANSCVFDQ